MKTAFLLLPFLVLCSCVSKTTDPTTTGGKINASAPYIWPNEAFPRNLRVSDAFDANEVANITAMSGAWETAIQNKKDILNQDKDNDSQLDRTPEVSSSALVLDDLGDDNINGIYKISRWPTSLPGSALAVTQIFGRRYNIGSGSEHVRIEHADILINKDLYDFRTGDAHVTNTFDFRTVVLHEMGHYLGLPHKYGETVMVPSIGEYSGIRAPTNMDAADLASKYSISLGSGSGSAMATATKHYTPNVGDSGQKIKIMIELMADGECVHIEDGVTVGRHQANQK